MDLFDIMGLIGVGIGLYCYAHVQWQRDYAKRLSYSLLNILGALLMIVSLFDKWNTAAFVCNASWCLISLYGVYRCLKYFRPPTATSEA